LGIEQFFPSIIPSVACRDVPAQAAVKEIGHCLATHFKVGPGLPACPTQQVVSPRGQAAAAFVGMRAIGRSLNLNFLSKLTAPHQSVTAA
jgi:hypothetical protein